MDPQFLRANAFVVEGLVPDLASYLGLSVEAVQARLDRRYYVQAWFYEFMRAHGNDYQTWLEESEFYLYNSTEWHCLVGLAGLCQGHFPPPTSEATCLDVGAGIGTHALIDALLGWRVTLVEINRHTRAFAEYRFGRHQLEAQHLAALPAEGLYTVVRLWDVVGHLVDLLPTLERALALISPGGWLHISFDNEHINSGNRDWHRNASISVGAHLQERGWCPAGDGLWQRQRPGG